MVNAMLGPLKTRKNDYRYTTKMCKTMVVEILRYGVAFHGMELVLFTELRQL